MKLLLLEMFVIINIFAQDRYEINSCVHIHDVKLLI